MQPQYEPEQLAWAAELGLTPEQLQYELDMGNIGIPEGVTPVRCPHGVNVWFGHECGACEEAEGFPEYGVEDVIRDGCVVLGVRCRRSSRCHHEATTTARGAAGTIPVCQRHGEA